MDKPNSRQQVHSLIPKQAPSKNNPTSPIFITQEDKNRSLRKLNDVLRFSFHYLDIRHEAFNCGGTDTGWFISLMETIKDVSRLSFNEFVNQRNHYDVHPHDWSKLDYKFDLPEHMWEQVDKGYQFRLSKSEGRVHGFFVSNTFYVVWLDPEHNLNPSQKHGGRKTYPPLPTPYELVKKEAEEAKRELVRMTEWLDEQTSGSN